MTKSSLTNKQSYFLKYLQEAETNGQSIKDLAEQLNIRIDSLYNYRYILRKKGWLAPVANHVRQTGSDASSFVAVSARESTMSMANDNLELKTQLVNGQPLWISVPASQLPTVLKALSS